MAHFRGIIQGSRGVASRLATKNSGLQVEAQSWQGKVTVRLWHDVSLGDQAEVSLSRHNGEGIERVLYRGPVSGATLVCDAQAHSSEAEYKACSLCHPK